MTSRYRHLHLNFTFYNVENGEKISALKIIEAEMTAAGDYTEKDFAVVTVDGVEKKFTPREFLEKLGFRFNGDLFAEEEILK